MDQRICAICLIVVVAFSSCHAMMWGGAGMQGGYGGPQGLSAYMGIMPCQPFGRGRGPGAGAPGAGVPGGRGGRGQQRLPGGPPGGPAGPRGGPQGMGMPQSANPNPMSFFMGMTVDVPDAPDMGMFPMPGGGVYGCFCQNWGSECFAFGVADSTCSRYGLCCMCENGFFKK